MKNKDFYDLKDLNFETRSIGNAIVGISVYSGFKENNEPIYCKQFKRNSNADTYEVLEAYTNWLNSEHSILEEKEKEYLQAVIKPFKNKVSYIKKGKNGMEGTYLTVCLIGINSVPEYINLPYFDPAKMYKNMEVEKAYTLEELGL